MNHTDRIFFDISNTMYDSTAPEKIGNFGLIEGSTSTVRGYADDNSLIIGSRGTVDVDDILVDQKLNSGHLSKTDRYITDKKTLFKIMTLKPHHTLYVTGHSLGGAIASMWSKEVARIKVAIVYNTAIQPHEIDTTVYEYGSITTSIRQ